MIRFSAMVARSERGLRRRIVGSEHVIPLCVLSAGALAAALPEWRPIWYQDDQLPSLFRLLHTDLGHHHGVVFPRFAPELGFGYGHLLHQLYPPLGFELAAWLHAIGLGYMAAVRAFFTLCLISDALGMYAYARVVVRSRRGAVLAALAYVWAPYVLLDAHKGGDFGESLAIAILPWSLLAFHLLMERWAWVRFGMAASGLAGVTLAHNITALFFTGLVCIYAVLLAMRQARVLGRCAAASGLARAIGAVLLALALSAAYWVPALVEMPYSRIQEQRQGSFSIGRYLFSPSDLLQRSLIFDYYGEAEHRYGLIAFVLTLGAMVSVGLAAGLAGAKHSRTSPEEVDSGARMLRPYGPDLVLLAAFGLVFGVVLVMQLRPTLPIWESVPLISFVQFPRRLFVFASFAAALVIGGLPWSLHVLLGGGRWLPSLGAGVVAVLLGVAGLPGIWWTPPVAASHRISDAEVGLGTAADRRFSERTAYDDFFPAWVTERATQVPQPPSPSQAEEYRRANGGPVPRVRVLERGYLRTTLETDSDQPSTVVFHTFYFPGWEARADGLQVAVEPVGPLGLARASVPAGRHVLELSFGETPLRLATDATSVVAVLFLAAVLVRGAGARRGLIGLGLGAAVFGLPWAAHLLITPLEQPAAKAIDREVLPSARLVGVEIAERSYQAGETLSATVLWQATAYTATDLQSGLRLESPGGAVIAERWARPGRESTPTGKWLVSELVPDPLVLPIPPGAPPGRYRLSAGLRDRMPNVVPIAELEVR